MRAAWILFPLLLASCGDTVKVANSNEAAQADEGTAPGEAMTAAARPVRVGDLGASFAACVAAGTTRHLRPGEALPVRAAPFESAAVTGSVAGSARFFICSRSHDQKWFGIVYDEGGTLSEACGVSAPVTTRGDYQGPCRSGWVSSAFVKLIAGNDRSPQLPAAPAEATREPVAGR